MGNNEPEQLPYGNPKDALLWVKLDVVDPKTSEYLAEVLNQLLDVLGFYNYVIDVGFGCLADVIFQACLNHALICCANVF